MRWKPGRGRSANIEDRRGSSGRWELGGLGGMIPGGGRGAGSSASSCWWPSSCSGRSCLSGGSGGDSASGGFDVEDITDILGQFSTAGGAGAGEDPLDPADDPDADTVDFVSFVLDDVQGFWDGHFADAGRELPAMQSWSCSATASSRGAARLRRRPDPSTARPTPRSTSTSASSASCAPLRRPGDFAQAYVLAHELGHHVQNVLGINAEVQRLQQDQPDRANELSVRLELQADCFAGIWAHSAFQRDLLSDGDIEEGITAAGAVGDDRLGVGPPRTSPTAPANSASRWLRDGYASGEPRTCNTFDWTSRSSNDNDATTGGRRSPAVCGSPSAGDSHDVAHGPRADQCPVLAPDPPAMGGIRCQTSRWSPRVAKSSYPPPTTSPAPAPVVASCRLEIRQAHGEVGGLEAAVDFDDLAGDPVAGGAGEPEGGGGDVGGVAEALAGECGGPSRRGSRRCRARPGGRRWRPSRRRCR